MKCNTLTKIISKIIFKEEVLMKKFMALVLTAALTLTSAAVVFADDYDYDYENGYEYEEVYEEVVVEFVDFTGTSRRFTSAWGAIIGYVPVFANNAALTTRIHNMVNDYYYNFMRHDNISRPRPTGQEVFRFTVDESYTAARIDILVMRDNMQVETLYTFFVDKATNTTITAADFEESLLAPTAVAEPVAAEEYVDEDVDADEDADVEVEGEVEVVDVLEGMFPIRVNAEAAGFTVNWDDGAVEVYDESLVLNILTGSVFATLTHAGEEMVSVTLDAAPINVYGRVYVPYTLLVDILGLEFELLTLADYIPVVALPAEVEEVEAEEYEYEAEEVEEYEEDEEYEEYADEDDYEEMLALVADLFEEFVEEGETFELFMGKGGITFIISSDADDLIEYADEDAEFLVEMLRELLGEDFPGFSYVILDLEGEELFSIFFEA